MPILCNEEDGGKVLVIHVVGKLVKADYGEFVPEFERLVREHGKLQVLFDMTGFHGWDAGDMGGHQVRYSSLCGHRSPCHGRRKEMASRFSRLLQAVYQGDDTILRP